MERLFFLIISLLFLTFLLSIAVGDVRELFNHHELEHINENSDHNYDEVVRAVDDLYSSLEDCGTNKKKLYNFEKPGFGKQLVNALNRVKYVNNDLSREEQKRIVPETDNINYINKINSVSYNRPNDKVREQNYDVEIGDFVSKKLHTNVNGHKISNNLKNGYKRDHNNSFRPRKRILSGDKIGNHLGIDYNSDNNNNNNFGSEYYNSYKNGDLMMNNRKINKYDEVVVKKSNDVSENQLIKNYIINSEQNNKSGRHNNDLKDEFMIKSNQLNKSVDSIIGQASVENHLVNSDYQNNKIKCNNDKKNEGYFFINKNGDSIQVKSKDFLNQEALESNVKNYNDQNNRSKYKDDTPMRNSLNASKNINSVIDKTDDLSNDVGTDNILTDSDQNNNSKYNNYKSEFYVKNNNSLNRRCSNAVDEKLNGNSNRENYFNNLVKPDSVLHASLKKNRKHYYKNKFFNEKLAGDRYERNVCKNNTDNDGYLDNEDENNFVMIDGMNFESGSSENGLKLKVKEEYTRGLSNNSFPEKWIRYDKSDNKIEGRTRIKRKPNSDIKLFNIALNGNKANKVSDTRNNGYFHTTKDKFGRNNDDNKFNVQSTVSPYLMDSSKSAFFPYSLETLALSTVFEKNRVSINARRLNNVIVSAHEGRCPILRMTTPSISGTDGDSELDFVVKLNRSGTSSDELKIAHVVSNFVANLLHNADRTGNMRKELGLCKTNDRRYPFHVNKQVDDQLLAGLMNCISSIMEESLSNQKCSEMPCELKEFVDWLLLNGSSAHDQFKQFLSTNGCQQRSFLFPPYDIKLATGSSSVVDSNQIFSSTIRQRQDNSNKSPKIMDSLKKYIDIDPSNIFSESNNFQHLQDKNPYGLFKRYLSDKKISPSGNNIPNLRQDAVLFNHIQYNGNDNDNDINNGISKNQIIDSLNINNDGEYDNDFSLVGSPYKDYVSNYNYENRLDINKKFKKRSDYLSDFETPIVYGNRDELEPCAAE